MNLLMKFNSDVFGLFLQAAFDYVYQHYYNDFEWFMKADDDTYVIMENLRYFLSNEDTNEPIYFGHWFKVRLFEHTPKKKMLIIFSVR